ncbi:hypothetical protein BAUCODRAFT_555446 [Baudoinia panamericana UAMH 10762]|uniref:Ribosomal RNA-processing protein 43 n=1 Tax=Baudoinia panamericana (strain UAMH 10762) TaxID=717646 RepID=M2MT23_BAUPA|nr:uncharacterized protein BAUCODRAFT_555446 [Baudoinia panamericana UAMH 10762]EMC94673.1 hypothetical protein BAUCODRAFT_555446 [Baudoinia panamericana UAMH 10762]
MANGTPPAPGLTFPPETFAKLTPRPFLQAHLQHKDSIRPNGRRPEEVRKPTVNTGSLSYSNGSAVVRVGDTAVVCGVRAEILLASDIPHPPNGDADAEHLLEDLGLLVPNVELSTGCSPTHLPGNPPGILAQALSYRILSLLHVSDLVNLQDLQIEYTVPQTDDDLPDAGPKTVVKAYWTLYIDILCIAMDGNPFDAAWTAVIAALRDTSLPRAWWDPDREIILCSPLEAEASRLRLRNLPMASTFAVYSTSSPLKQRAHAESWVLADPDGFEEDVCHESVTVVLSHHMDGKKSGILRVEKHGGGIVDNVALLRCVQATRNRAGEWCAVLGIT